MEILINIHALQFSPKLVFHASNNLEKLNFIIIKIQHLLNNKL